MSILYCIYKNNKYKAKIHNGMIKLTTKKKTDGFDNYVDVLGNKHDDLFVKKSNLKKQIWCMKKTYILNTKVNIFNYLRVG